MAGSMFDALQLSLYMQGDAGDYLTIVGQVKDKQNKSSGE